MISDSQMKISLKEIGISTFYDCAARIVTDVLNRFFKLIVIENYAVVESLE